MKLLQLGKCHQKNNKRGGMLVIVLMIFAVSLILISSAMTTTLSSRSRYYVNTERSQERLTLTCAAEAIVDAIQNQEITDTQILNMAKNSEDKYFITGVDSTAYPSEQTQLTSNDGKSIAPGLRGSTDTSKSMTYFTVEHEEGGGANDVVLTFHTLIDVTGDEPGTTENLKVHLKWEESGSDHDLCGNMVTAGDDSNPNVMNVQDLMVNTTQSYTVFHGNVLMSQDSQSYVANTAVITGRWLGGQGTYFFNDVVFYGKNATIDASSQGNGLSTPGDVIFIGENATTGRSKVFSGGTLPDGFNFNTNGLYLYNAELNNIGGALQGNSANVSGIWEFNQYSGATTQGKYWVVDTGSKVTRTTSVTPGNVIINNDVSNTQISVPGSSAKIYTKDNINTTGTADDKTAYTRISTKGKNYRNDPDLKKAVQTKVPASHGTYEAYATMPADNTIMSGCGHVTYNGGHAENSSNTDRHLVMPAGTYSGGEVFIDLTKGNASIYIQGSVTFDNFAIRVSNTNIGSNKLVIVLAKGATLNLTKAPHSWESNSPTQNGIISCDQRHSPFNADGWNKDMRATSGQIPGCIIVGLGKNTVLLQTPSILDAYVSLAGLGSNASTFAFGGGGPNNPVAFYGRIECAKIVSGQSQAYSSQGLYNGGQIHMEYCPGLDEQSSGDEPLHTCFTAESYEYFYD